MSLDAQLQGVDPALRAVILRASEISPVPFGITEGVRDEGRQRKLVAEGKSQTLHSNHLTGRAVDFHVLNPDGSANWEFPQYEKVWNAAIKRASEELGVPVNWGGNWKSLKDGPHIELPRDWDSASWSGGRTKSANSGETMTDARPSKFAMQFIPSGEEKPRGASNFALKFIPGGEKPKAEAKPAPKAADQSFASGVVDAVTQGVTLGQGRKITAAESALLGRTPEGEFFNYEDSGGFIGGFGQRYSDALAAENAQQGQFREDNPVTATVAEIGGAVVPALATGGTGLAARGLAATPAGVAARLGSGGATRGAQYARAAGAGAGAGAVYGQSEAELDGIYDQLVSTAIGTATGAVGGAAGQAVANGVGALYARVIGNPAMFRNGRLTPEGIEALQRNGIDPATISNDFAKAFASRIREAGGATDEAVRMATADEFGIPLTRGQATGDEAAIAFEEAARNNARGEPARAAVRGVDDAARQRVGQAVDSLAGSPDDAIGAAERVGGAVSGAAREARAAGDAAYRAADNAGPAVVDRRAFDGFTRGAERGTTLPALVDAPQFQGIVDRAEGALRNVTLAENAAARGAITELRTLARNVAEAPDGTIGVDFKAVERLRSKITTAQRNATDPQVKQELGAIIGAMDEWTDDVFDNALIAGDDAALDALKKARATWKDYKRRFGTYTGKDADLKEAQRMIAQIAERDLTGGEIANWLWGASKIGGKGSSVRLVQRLKSILPGEDREAVMQAIKAGAWRRVAESSVGEKFGPQRMATRIRDFVSGDGRALAGELFTGAERAQMLRFAKALEIMVPPATATNPSRTSYGVARIGQDMMQAMGTMIGLSQGGATGGIGALVAGALMKSVPSAMRARTIPATQALDRSVAAAQRRGAGSVGGSVGATMAAPNDLADLLP